MCDAIVSGRDAVVCVSWGASATHGPGARPQPAPVQPPQHAAVSGSLSAVHSGHCALHAAPAHQSGHSAWSGLHCRATTRGQAAAQLHRALPRLTSHTCPALHGCSYTAVPPSMCVGDLHLQMMGVAFAHVRVSADSSVCLCGPCSSAVVSWECRLRIEFHERLCLGLHTGVAVFYMLCDISGHALCCIRNQVLPWCCTAWCIA